MDPSLEKIKKTALFSVKQAGKLLWREYQRFDRSKVKVKSKHEIITKADLISERAIISRIRKQFPSHRIISEEKGKMRGESEYLWVIDPLDGTTNFSIHNPLWAVSVAVARQGRIMLGLVYSPCQNELFMAEKKRGARKNGKKIRVSGIKGKKVINTFCHGSSRRDIQKALSYMNTQKRKYLDCRQLGSASLELAYVACGRTESIMIPGANSWDVAAGVLLVEEAGGRVTDFGGQKWDLQSKDMLASNGKIHNSLLKIIAAND